MAAAERVKELEQQTRHDVKAVELYLAEQLREHDSLADRIPMLHFACTSWDINSSAYGIMLARARSDILSPVLEALIGQLHCMAREHAGLPMLARTHGQPASPTTLGKELAVFVHRLQRQLAVFAEVPAMAKCSGATGNYNAHYAACPDVDWPDLSRRFLSGLGLEQNPVTTQIEPYDWMAEYCDALARINRILIDLSRDAWTYISMGYFRQKAVEGETGSSTMPHKVNPINLENAEGNLGLSNALAGSLFGKAPRVAPAAGPQRFHGPAQPGRRIGACAGGLDGSAERSGQTLARRVQNQRGPRLRLGNAGRGGANGDARPWL